MIETVVKGVGGTIETEFVGRRPVSCTVSLYNGDGDPVVSAAACTVDTVNTTSTSAVERDDTVIPLASVTDIVGGRRYKFGNEDVGVKSIAALSVTLWAPLGRDHVSGEAFQGVRVTRAVSAVEAAAAWADGYAIFTPDAGTPQTEAVHCTRHRLPDAMISAYDVRGVFPKDQAAVSAETDQDLAYRAARDNFLADLGGKAIANSILGVAQFRRLTAMRYWLDREVEFGEQWAPEMAILQKRYDVLLDKVQSLSPVDEDGDGETISGPEKHALTGLDLETL